MAFEPEFLDLMTQSVTIALPTGGYTDRGAPAFAAGTSYTSRIVEKNKMIRTAEGQERVSRAAIYLATTDVISPEAQLTMPTGFTPTNPPILAVERYPDEHGPHHTVLRI